MNKLKKVILFVLGLFFILVGVIFLKGAHTFSVISVENPDFSFLPKEDQRWDILILGEQPLGGLTDTIMIFSYKKDTGEAALISIPRDLWVSIPGYGKQKINYAYVVGERKDPNGGGLKLAEEVVEKVTGLDIDFGIKGDVYALKEIVDTLGGIDVWEDRYFSTDFYGNYVKIHPGKNHLSGTETLAYIGSRSIDSDFGRMRRQQKVLEGIKNKVFSLQLLTRPDKIWGIFNSLNRHIETDLPLSQMKDLIQMASSFKIKKMTKMVFDKSNYLYSTHTRAGAYILLPKGGDFSEIQQRCQNIFQYAESNSDSVGSFKKTTVKSK